MADCQSTYTINRRTGEMLRCERHVHGNPFRTPPEILHAADHGGLGWTWGDREADRTPGVPR